MQLKPLLFSVIILASCSLLNAQISFYVDEDISYPDIRVRIGEDVTYPDVRIKIGETVSYSDFTVGITNNKSTANFIITTSKYGADKTIRAGDDVSYPDIRIRFGENTSYSDLSIKIKKSGSVDYIVYSEKEFVSMNDLIIALLPAINKQLDYKLEGIPTLSESGNGFGVPEDFAVIAHSVSTSSEARKVLSKIGESAYSLASKNLILVVCRSGLSYPMNSSYNSLSELNSDADSQLNISGDNFHVYIYQMDSDGTITERQHIDYKAEDD
jgi:hypothetical protein